MTREHADEKDRNENVNADLRLLYQTSVSEIAFFKQQQWRVTNYGLLLYGVIVAIPKVLNFNLAPYEYFLLFLIAFLALVVGWYVLWSLEEALSKSRERLFKAEDQLSKEFKDARKNGQSEDQEPKRPEDKPSLLWLFGSVISLGFLIVSWLLFKMAYCI